MITEVNGSIDIEAQIVGHKRRKPLRRGAVGSTTDVGTGWLSAELDRHIDQRHFWTLQGGEYTILGCVGVAALLDLSDDSGCTTVWNVTTVEHLHQSCLTGVEFHGHPDFIVVTEVRDHREAEEL